MEYSDNYSKILGSSWQYHRDEKTLRNAAAIADFHVNKSALFKFKQKITSVTDNNGTKKCWNNAVAIKILKYILENSWNVFN